LSALAEFSFASHQAETTKYIFFIRGIIMGMHVWGLWLVLGRIAPKTRA
jgi:hypothetical protein